MPKIDILNRKEFVDNLVNLTENIAINKKSTSFAINGSWGCGKSFVLDMYEEALNQIEDEGTLYKKYFVVRYNCWKFDYYDEPLVAIVSELANIIERENSMFGDEETKHKVIGVLKSVGVSLLSMANDSLKEKLGVDIQKIYEVVKNGLDSGEVAYNFSHEYDMYFAFKEVLSRLQDVINRITKNYTFVFIVDELDRCLPEYSIKVLERLHHLTENVENVITVISIDKSQLEKSIEHIFGFDNAEKYLKKFIHFELQLDVGKVSDSFVEKYSEYISMFDKDLFPFSDSVEEFSQAIFTGIDVRTQEQLMDRIMLTHRLLYTDSKDYVFMCMEMLLTVLICHYGDKSCFDKSSINDGFNNVFYFPGQNVSPKFASFFKEKLEDVQFNEFSSGFYNENRTFRIPEKASLYAAFYLIWYYLHSPRLNLRVSIDKNSMYKPIYDYVVELKKFAETVRLIK